MKKAGINIEINGKPYISCRYAARHLKVAHGTIKNRCLSDKWPFYKMVLVNKVADGEKRCTKCGEAKLISEFYKRTISPDGVSPSCKKCMNNERKQYMEENPEKIRIQKSESYYRNIDTAKNYIKENSIEIKKNKKEYDRTHRKERNMRRQKRLKNDFAYRLNCNMGTGIWKSLKRGKNGNHWESLVSYTLIDLKNHLEGKFTEGMSWENYGYGKDKWNVDHKRPVSSFNITSSKCEDFTKCWSLDNLQPLWQPENMKKSDKLFVQYM